MLVIALFCVLSCSLMPSLVACKSEQPAIEVVSDQEVIRDGIQKTLDPLKTPTRESISKFVNDDASGGEAAQSNDSSFDIYELIGHALRGFSYSIDSIEVRGNAANASITITHIDTTEAMQQAANSAQQPDSLQEIADLYNSEDPAMHSELGKQLVQRLYRSLDTSQTMKSDRVTLTLTKSGNEWTVDKSSVSRLVDALFSERM